MSDSSGLLLVGAVAAVGVLHTIVPDHWVPITLIARQRGWSKAATARVALKAGAGHVLSTLAIALVIWIGGVAVATRFGYWVDTIASVALIGFGAWIAIGAWRDLRSGHGHSHAHGHGHSHDFSHLQGASSVHGPELQKIDTEHGEVELSIFEAGITCESPMVTLRAEISDDADRQQVLTAILSRLRERLGVEHATVQMEHGPCADPGAADDCHDSSASIEHGHEEHSH